MTVYNARSCLRAFLLDKSFNASVNVSLQVNRQCQSCDHAAIVDGVGQKLAFAVFQVFVQHLVAADVVVPDIRNNALKVLAAVDANDSRAGIVLDEFHPVISSGALIFGNGSAKAGTFEQMDVGKYTSQLRRPGKERSKSFVKGTRGKSILRY